MFILYCLLIQWYFIPSYLVDVSCVCSPGRSPVSFDHEIMMMNHVYKERFPKVRKTLILPPQKWSDLQKSYAHHS